MMSETINPENNAPADSIEAKISDLCKPWDSRKIESLQDFLEWVDTQEKILKILNKNFDFYDSFELYYRGVSSCSYEDIPSVLREPSYQKNEAEFIRKCQTERFQEFSDDQTRFDTLVKMQHYGFPTRLLDITRNPLVALYFASQQSHTENLKEDDGKVEAIFISKTKIVTVGSEACAIYSSFPFLSQYNKIDILSNFYAVHKDDENKQLGSSCLREMSDLIIQKSQKDIFDFDGSMIKKTEGGNKINEFGDLMNVFCVIPRMNNERIKKQAGAFLIYGPGISSICKLLDLSKYLKNFMYPYSDINIYIEEINKCLEVFKNTKKIQDSLANIEEIQDSLANIEEIQDSLANIEEIQDSLQSYSIIYQNIKNIINEFH